MEKAMNLKNLSVLPLESFRRNATTNFKID
jgi:hypothetical protein